MVRKTRPKAETSSKIKLPPSVTGLADVKRLIRELEIIEDSLLQLGIRAAGTTVKMPKTSYLMEQVIRLNKLNLLQPPDRETLKEYLLAVEAKACVLHFSFGADPSPAFIEKLVTWLRREIDPEALLTIGLQPNLGAGCILRTTNKYFDLSLRQSFVRQRQLLRAELTGQPPATPPETKAAPAPAVPAGEAAA